MHSNPFQWLTHLVGNTPMSKITCTYKGKARTVYVKHEHYNMTGSIKDRIALHMLYDAKKTGALKPDDTIVEVSSGNTGIAFAAMGKALGHKVKIFMPSWMSQERINLIKSFGAEVILLGRDEGGFIGCIKQAEALKASRDDIFLPAQFSNQSNADAHAKTTAPEMHDQLKQFSVTPNAFIAGVGTGGTVMGVHAYLKRRHPNIKVHPLEPANSPTLSTGCKIGVHRIQGISDDFVPDLINLNALEDIVAVDDGDAIIMAKKLSNTLGLGIGISSGANFIGALMLQNNHDNPYTVVTVFPDDNKKYLSTDLMNDEPTQPHYLSQYVQNLKIEGTVSVRPCAINDALYAF